MKMPTRARECLALRFRQNWMAKYPVDVPNNGSVPLDDSLTSLNWLQNLNIMKTLNPTPPASPEPDTPTINHGSLAELFKQRPGDARVNPNSVLNVKHESRLRGACSHNTGSHVFSHRSTPLGGHHVEVAPPLATNFSPYHDKINYKTNSSVKPPYSYATLICMAMRESKKNKITLAGIYNWITENFSYYRVADPSWQNSIRHNLSLNKSFQKVARRKDEPGKGGFWRINPEYSDMFVNGVFKKRRAGGSPMGIVSGVGSRDPPGLEVFSPAKRIKLEPQDDADEGYLAAMAISNELSEPNDDNAGDSDPHHALQGLHESLSDHRGVVKSDFNWNAIFHQDIEVSGVSIKTEDIIDAQGDSCDSSGSPLGVGGRAREMESPITALSPPASDRSSEIGLDDLLNPDFNTDSLDNPLDLSTGGELDLTITGHSLKAPDWWSETISRGLMSPEHPSSSGLNSPVAPSPVHDHPGDVPHPWAEQRALDEAIANFDLDLQNLFEDDL